MGSYFYVNLQLINIFNALKLNNSLQMMSQRKTYKVLKHRTSLSHVKIKGCTCSHRLVGFFMKEVGIECFHIFAVEYPTWDGQNISAIKMRKLGTCKTFPRLLVATSKNLIKIYNTLFPYRDDSRFLLHLLEILLTKY